MFTLVKAHNNSKTTTLSVTTKAQVEWKKLKGQKKVFSNEKSFQFMEGNRKLSKITS